MVKKIPEEIDEFGTPKPNSGSSYVPNFIIGDEARENENDQKYVPNFTFRGQVPPLPTGNSRASPNLADGLMDSVRTMKNLGIKSFYGKSPQGDLKFNVLESGKEELDDPSFVMRPHPKIRTEREVALISLHPYLTRYLNFLDSRVRPIDLTILELSDYFPKSSKGYLHQAFIPCSNFRETLKPFSDEFYFKYPEVEQVYVFSVNSFGKRSTLPPEPLPFGPHLNYPFEGHLSEELTKVLSPSVIKSFLILQTDRAPFSKNFSPINEFSTAPDKIKIVLERSLRFSSW